MGYTNELGEMLRRPAQLILVVENDHFEGGTEFNSTSIDGQFQPDGVRVCVCVAGEGHSKRVSLL